MTHQEATAVERKCDRCGRTLQRTEPLYWVPHSRLEWRVLCCDCAHPKKAALAKEKKPCPSE
jgi:hypothetical protein